MVKKLIKHELYAYFRSVWPVTIVVLGLTVLSWIMSFAQNSLFYWMLSLIMLVVLIYGVIAMLLGPIAKRFLFSLYCFRSRSDLSILRTRSVNGRRSSTNFSMMSRKIRCSLRNNLSWRSSHP